MDKNIVENLIRSASINKIVSHDQLLKTQKEFCQKYKISFFKNSELLQAYHKLVKNKEISPDERLKRLFVLKPTRSQSGIVVVSVLTKPYDCPGKCIYCPTEAGIPKSYLANEPAVMRAMSLDFDPYKQVETRLAALEANGHPIDKINIRIIGGTWSYYKKDYQEWFIKELFRACNSYKHLSIKAFKQFNPSITLRAGNKTIEQLQSENESAKCRIVEISVETRQDYINIDEIKRLRNFGATKVELGVQSLYNDVLKLNKRGHNIETTIKATKMLKDAGFKVSYQMMANLPGSNLTRDKKMFKELFTNADFRPDYLKIYPLAIVKNTGVYDLFKAKKFTPYTKSQLIDLLKFIKKNIPYYCRIERVIRDIPTEYIVSGGVKSSNLRQILQVEMKKDGVICKCIRCREIGDRYIKNEKTYLFREDYDASGGKEIFLSMENKNRTKLYSMLRLRISKDSELIVLKGAALIREIHTYGQELAINAADKSASQHKGLGKRLIIEAEKIARNNVLKKIAVISGVGVRGYFRKLGYNLKDTYMLKKLL